MRKTKIFSKAELAEAFKRPATLPREKCAVLHLGLQHHWYDMIASGTKLVEFRRMTPYWAVRIDNWMRRAVGGKIPVLQFRSGYGKAARPLMTFAAGNPPNPPYICRSASDPVEHEELGEFPKDRYVIFIGSRVELVEVKS